MKRSVSRGEETSAERGLRVAFAEELVVINSDSQSNLAQCGGTLNAHHLAGTSHPEVGGQRDLPGENKAEVQPGSHPDLRIGKNEHAPRADVPRLARHSHWRFAADLQRHRQLQRKAAHGTPFDTRFLSHHRQSPSLTGSWHTPTGYSGRILNR